VEVEIDHIEGLDSGQPRRYKSTHSPLERLRAREESATPGSRSAPVGYGIRPQVTSKYRAQNRSERCRVIELGDRVDFGIS